MEWQGSWDEHLDLVEFSYNNSYQGSIQMALFEALYGQCFRSSVCWDDFTEAFTLGLDLLLQMTDQVKLICHRLKAAQDRQKTYADLKRCTEEFEVGDHVLLKVSPMRGVVRFSCQSKVEPKVYRSI